MKTRHFIACSHRKKIKKISAPTASSAPRKLARRGSIFTHIHERPPHRAARNTRRARVVNDRLSHPAAIVHPPRRVVRNVSALFKVAELGVATNGFEEARLIGRGSFAAFRRSSL